MSPGKIATNTPAIHPLDPLNAEEIVAATSTVRKYVQEKGIKAVRFLNVLVDEPHKSEVIAAGFFPAGEGAPASSGHAAPPPRQLSVHMADEITGSAYDLTLDASNIDAVTVLSMTKQDAGVQPALTLEELVMSEQAIRKDSRVIEAAKDVGVSVEELFCDGWSIGWDERFPNKRVQQCLCYARYGKDENQYAHPLDFLPIVDNLTGEVLAIDYPAHRVAKDGKLNTKSTAPPTEANFAKPDTRDRIPPPLAKHDYLPDLATRVDSDKPIEMRTDIKPLSVVQPEGVSFKRTGNTLEWGKFKLHVGFHPREGMVLSNIVYKDDEVPGFSKASPKERPLFYRASFVEMVVPYAEPAHPHYRKFAFDIGEYGLGFLANSLALGCDCLGTIEYMDGHFVKHDGSVETVKNAICIHEEDAGTLWKHTDYRPGGRTHNVRNRKLVLSMVCTVANYEYQFNWNFHLDGNIECEIKLTGILNLYQLAQGESTGGFGTEVAPRINAHYHQHLFSVRLDPHIDGQFNSVSEQHIEPSPAPSKSDENWAGNAFTAPTRILKTTGEGVRDAQADIERTWTIVNENVKHYSSGKPVGYKIMCKDMPRLHCHHDGIAAIRAPFAKHHLWTLPYHPKERYPSGMFVPQTFKAPKDSIEEWVGDGKASVQNKDIVTYVTVGTTHIPRPEDFPVMPAETCRFMLKPVNFFRRNPTLDVPSTQDAKSIAANAAGVSVANGNGSCCRS
ncbi:peroxisomal copper amine oxidase [Meira miltonrushii]|uniref:Amine oxidase n=1 Tax=Meira miltonrushii TaxID=1280837 RepID=A0A316V475_9BASI|nr:peroxisomal copper amine oxidase [Meira miltonrushii]PWN31808.1 peroxisomal copper amine oxidase [Meira miltonrushii]